MTSSIKAWLKKILGVKIPETMFDRLRQIKVLGFSPALVIDVGAYSGEWSRAMLTIFPESSFVMIEPQAAAESSLVALTKEHSNVQYIRALVGRHQQKGVRFFEMYTGSSIYPEQTNVSRKEVAVDMTTLDDVIHVKFPGKIFLKLDVQGAELDVLKGAINCLKSTDFILLEASLLNYNLGAPQFAEVVAYLNGLGFVVFDICDIRRKSDGTLFQVDLLFARHDSEFRRRVNFRITSSI